MRVKKESRLRRLARGLKERAWVTSQEKKQQNSRRPKWGNQGTPGKRKTVWPESGIKG